MKHSNSNLRAALRPQQSGSEPTQATSMPAADTASLEKRVGPLARVGLSMQESRAAKQALAEINAAMITAEKNVAVTQTHLAEAAILTSLVATAMPAIGALAVMVNSATTAVDQALTNCYGADIYTHQKNLSENQSQVSRLVSDGQISEDQAKVLYDSLEEAAVDDIVRSQDRMKRGKQAVGELAAHAIGHVEDAKSRFS